MNSSYLVFFLFVSSTICFLYSLFLVLNLFSIKKKLSTFFKKKEQPINETINNINSDGIAMCNHMGISSASTRNK